MAVVVVNISLSRSSRGGGATPSTAIASRVSQKCTALWATSIDSSRGSSLSCWAKQIAILEFKCFYPFNLPVSN